MIALHRPSHAFGIGYSFWVRGRWSFAAAWLLVVALALAAQLVPAFRMPFAFGAGVKLATPPILFAVPLVLLPVISLLNVFTYGPVDVSSKASGFPMHARLLPLSTHALVGWPMLFGTSTIASLWLVLLAFVLRPLGLTTSIVWPTTIVIACTAWVQAVAWIPLPLRFVRVPLFLAFVGIPFCFASLDPRSGDSFWSFEACMLLWAVAAYALATIGLKRARTGTTEGRLLLPRGSTSASEPDTVLPPFPSASAARRWYELRRTTSFFAKAFAIATLPFIVICLLSIRYPHSVLAHRMGSAGPPISSTWAAVFLIVGPILASAAMGGYVGRLDRWQTAGMASFFALRPVRTARMVADKLVSAGLAAAVLFASATVVALFAFWACTSNAPPAFHAAVDRWVANGAVVDVLLVAIAFALFLWRNLAVDLWTTMTGHVWPSRVVACYAGIAVAGLPLMLTSLHEHDLFTFVPLVVRVIVVAKLAAAALVAYRLLRRGIVSGREIALAAAAWCIVAALMLALVAHFVDVSWTVTCFVAALVPLARIGLAPLALDKSRHG